MTPEQEPQARERLMYPPPESFDFVSHLHRQTGTDSWVIEELIGGAANHTVRVTSLVAHPGHQEEVGDDTLASHYREVLHAHTSVVLKQAPDFLAKATHIPFSPYRQVVCFSMQTNRSLNLVTISHIPLPRQSRRPPSDYFTNVTMESSASSLTKTPASMYPDFCCMISFTPLSFRAILAIIRTYTTSSSTMKQLFLWLPN